MLADVSKFSFFFFISLLQKQRSRRETCGEKHIYRVPLTEKLRRH